MKEIELTRGCVALVDDEDYEELNRYTWCTASNLYAKRNGSVNGKRFTVLMHRQILNAPNGIEVDHVNGERLDYRKGNLRLATFSENQRNSKCQKNNKLGIKGVFWKRSKNRFIAYISPPLQKQIWLGSFKTAQEAKEAYCKAAKELHGEFANLD